MMCPDMLKITSWLLLIAAMLQTGWSVEKPKNTNWEQCVPKCECKNVDGRKQAKCENTEMNDIPTGLSDEIQILVFNGNDIGELENHIFTNRGLPHLQKIFLKNCSIEEVHKDAFAGLGLVSLIDLSSNKIKRLDPGTFSQAINLRNVYLNNNFLRRLDDKLFSNLPQLQTVEFNFNRISDIGDRTFFNLTKLKSLQFRNNALVHLKPSIFQLVGNQELFFDLRNNPWRCDCQLRPFFDYVKNNSFSSQMYCSEPEYMQGGDWETLTRDKFACKPSITLPRSTEIVAQSGEKLILSCQVIGDPKPEMKWFYTGMEGRPLNNETNNGLGTERKYTIYESGDTTEWCNLTISNFSISDKGVYRCEARNEAGLDERKVTVLLGSGPPWLPSNNGDIWTLLLYVIAGLACALFVLLCLCYCCCRRADTFMTKKPQNSSMTANGDVTHHIVMEPEQQKTLLITAVNPVQKPPRKYDSSPQSENGGTELTELNRNLLDDNSVQAGTSLAGDSMDDRRSTNSLEPLSSCNSQDNLLVHERPRIVARAHHPPDLLAFSSRRQQASPANSLVSNDAGDYSTISRFRHLHSPVRSPIYQHHHANAMRAYSPTYETMVYGRTQSPFSTSSAVTPIVSHRAGYVTIPRRPRGSSWSSAPTPTLDDAAMAAIAAAFKAEPVYDNLGPRTTADGSSALSLTRKLAAESPSMGANMRSRPLPPAPLYSSHTLPHKAKLNHVFLSIRENEEPHFHPVVREPASGGAAGVIKPLPLQYSPPATEPLLPAATPDKRRASWAIAKPETGTLRRPSAANDDEPAKGAKAKVPPKPPPKPKKNGPLFEDEGEDGTEV